MFKLFVKLFGHKNRTCRNSFEKFQPLPDRNSFGKIKTEFIDVINHRDYSVDNLN